MLNCWLIYYDIENVKYGKYKKDFKILTMPRNALNLKNIYVYKSMIKREK